jgi:hypothetical protein
VPGAARLPGHAGITTTLYLYGHLYPADMDLWVDRLDAAGGEAGTARIRPDDEDDDPDAGVSAR